MKNTHCPECHVRFATHDTTAVTFKDITYHQKCLHRKHFPHFPVKEVIRLREPEQLTFVFVA